jgi:hypothetical protein
VIRSRQAPLGVRPLVSAAAWIVLMAATPAPAQFRDVTAVVPLGSETTAGIAWVDFDGDGDLDVFGTTYGDTLDNEFNRLYENVGTRFVDHPIEALQLGPYLCAGSAWADFDDDGDADVFVTSESRAGTALFRNDGADAFIDVTPPVMRADSSFYTPVWVDYDLDGDLDLSVASRFGGRLFRNDGGGAFANRTPVALDVLTWSVEWSDWDRDGDPDAFLGTIDQPLVLARNDGGGAFRDVAMGSLGGGTDGAFSGGFADYDRDGDDDLYVTYFYEPARLFRNEGSFGFVDVTPALLHGTGVAYTSSWCDFDLDSDPDVLRLGHVPDGTALYRNDATSFRDVSTLLGTVTQNNVWSGAWGEWDGDGRPDLFLGLHGSSSDRLLRNENGPTRHWLRVDLVGALSSRQGIGARVDVTAGGRTQSRQVSGGGDGWCSQEPAFAWFGLGGDVTAQVQVSWPSGQRQVIGGVAADRVLIVAEPGLVPALEVVPAGTAFDLNLRLDGARVTSATLFARTGGPGGEFSAFPLLAIGGVALRARLPADFVTQGGMEYWVQYRLSGGSPRATPYAGASGPAFLPAEFSNLASPATLPARRFTLFGFPFVPSDSTPAALFADELGAADDERWRLGRWDPRAGRYREASDSTLSLGPGHAFWLIADRDVRPAASGRGRDIRTGAAIDLEPGWNQVAHPFFFPVLLADVDFSGAPNVERRIVRYGSAGYEDAAVLRPWEGFWIHNGSASTETIVVAPRPAPAGREPPAPTAEAQWGIVLAARQGGETDGGNVAGVAVDAAEGRDRGDTLEPPAAPGHVRLWFEAPGDDGVPRELTRDLRTASPRGHLWEVTVSSAAGERVELTWEGRPGLPAGFDAVLFPRETGARVALAERGLALPAGVSHRFRLAVGAREFLAAVEAGEIDPPPGLVLGAPWPNPFTNSTNFAYGVPSSGRVTLTIHDVRGRLVRRLVSGTVAGGRHAARWDGDDETGRAGSSGVYFVRLRGEDRTVTRKVLLAR